MEVIIKECEDCPFLCFEDGTDAGIGVFDSHYCSELERDISGSKPPQTIPNDCPLRKEPITYKLV